jgi:glutamate racemase
MHDDPRHRPIGVFDSGVGGLSIVRALWAELPAEDILYVADSANCPYGPRSRVEIQRLSLAIADFLVRRGAKAIVVACNTASAAALEQLRAAFPATPIVGMVPAVKPAAAWTRTGIVGVLATPMTFDGALYHDVVRDYAEGVQVQSVVCPGLVELVEGGQADSEATQALLAQCLAPLLARNADALVLGCTHYPFLQNAIASLAGDRLRVFEPSDAVARQTRRVLERADLLAQPGRDGTTMLFSTRSASELHSVAQRLLGLSFVAHDACWHEGMLLTTATGTAAESRL